MLGWKSGIKVREGAYYLTKCGDVVGPALRHRSLADTDRCWEIDGCHYYSNGTAFGKAEGWALELVEEIPESLMNSLISRNEHGAKMRQLQRRIGDLEAALSAFSGLKKAMEVAATIRPRTETAQQREPSTDSQQNETGSVG